MILKGNEIIFILEEQIKDLKDSLYEARKLLKNAIPIPDNATNGDVIKAMFPTYDIEIEGNYVTCWIDEYKWIGFNGDWWNAPYKTESEVNR